MPDLAQTYNVLAQCPLALPTPTYPQLYIFQGLVYVNKLVGGSLTLSNLKVPYPAFSSACVDDFAVGFLVPTPVSQKVCPTAPRAYTRPNAPLLCSPCIRPAPVLCPPRWQDYCLILALHPSLPLLQDLYSECERPVYDPSLAASSLSQLCAYSGVLSPRYYTTMQWYPTPTGIKSASSSVAVNVAHMQVRAAARLQQQQVAHDSVMSHDGMQYLAPPATCTTRINQ